MQMKEKTSYASVYEDMQDILEKPELYDEVITEFSAGGLGGCAMQHKITIAELVRCWSHPEYHTLCHSCGKIAYITKWAGHVNGSGYWEIQAYCPHCRKNNHYYRNIMPVAIHFVHWTKMRDIEKEEKDFIKRLLQKSQIKEVTEDNSSTNNKDNTNNSQTH